MYNTYTYGKAVYNSEETSDKSDSDSGLGAESSSLVVTLTSSDSGTGVDSLVEFVHVVTEKYQSDLGTSAEAGSLEATLSGSDSGEGVEHFICVMPEAGEKAVLEASVTGSESVVGSEKYILSVALESQDSGTGSELEDKVEDTTDKFGSDSGTGVDAVIARDLYEVDSGLGVESSNLTPKSIFDSDYGTGADDEYIEADLTEGDFSVGSGDILTYVRELIDGGEGVDKNIPVSAVGNLMELITFTGLES